MLMRTPRRGAVRERACVRVCPHETAAADAANPYAF